MVLFVIAAALFAVVAALWLLRAAIYLVIGAGYVLFYGTIAAGYVLFAAGWLFWQFCRLGYRALDWLVDKCAPPIAARWHQWRESRAVTAPVTAERRPPVKEIGVVHWGYGHLNLARTAVRELPSRKSSAVARRWRPDRGGPRRRSLRG
jgi:hypothetical protein